MAFCSKCGAQVPEGTTFCANCGTPVGGAAAPAPMVDVYDHTAEFTETEINEGKVFAMLCYLLGVFGVALVYLGAKENKFAMFHARQTLNITVATVFCCTLGAIPCGIGFLAAAVLYVITWIQFFSSGSGKAKETAILRGMGCFKC